MVTASIVTYKNNLDILKATIESYLNATHNSKLYVIDNSPDSNVENLCKQHPLIEYIPSYKNIGYGKAHNIAIKLSSKVSKYHLVLNPDVFFEPNIIHELVEHLEKNEDIGLIMPKVVYPNGNLQPLCKLLPSPHHVFIRRFLFPFKKLLQKINYEYEMKFTNYNNITEAPFLSGCFMLVRTDAFKKIGLFDERFFLYFEDTDLSRRIHKYFKTIYYPHVSIQHIHERGAYKEFRLLIQAIKSGIEYFNKWGWFFDRDRNEINKKVLIRHRVNGYSKSLKG